MISIANAPKNGLMRQYKASVKVDLSIGDASPADGLTWPQAVAEAQQHNPSLIEAKLFIQQGEKQVDIGDAGFLPTVTANAGINRGQGQQIVNGGVFNTSAGSYQGSLDGTWNIFDGFSTLATRDLNLAAVQNRQAAYDQASSALYLSLGEAFDQLLYDQNNMALQKLLVQRYRADTLYQEQEFKGGLTALWTYEKAQSDEASQVWSFKQAKYSLQSDQAALAILLGRDADAPDLSVAGTLTVTAAPEDFHGDLRRMLQDNPTLRYYRSLVAEDDAALWNAESTRYPSLSASGSWGTSGEENWGPRNREWQGSLNLSYELFAGGGAEAAITQADQALKQAQTTADDELHQWEAALLKAWTAYIGGYERLPSAAMAVRAGADRFATVGALYQSGREEFLDYEQAESIYSGAQSGLLGQLLAAAEAQVAYKNALGMTLEDAAASPAP
ncbi:MAG TPA: TolC family protein [bacterium]|nr:TolC family protein [bacterium]